MAKPSSACVPDVAASSGDAPEQREEPTRVFHVLVSKIDSTAKSVLFFPYPPSLQLERECPAGYEVRQVDAASSGVRMTFTVTKRFMYNAIAHVFKAANVRKSTTTSANWNIFWGHHLKASEFAALLPFQRVNHFPGSFELGRKDRLCHNLLRMRKKHAAAYSGVIPETYLTANEYDKQQFLTQFHAQPHVLWILKPPNLSCGRGIKLVSAASSATPKLSKKKAYVAQKYIAQPFLINELKFDLRIYVLVTSFDPLRIYRFHDGLVRFCTEKYSTSKRALASPFGHLTNYSVNKKNTAAFQQNQDLDGDESGDSNNAAFSSSKWSLAMLYKYLEAQGKSKELASFHVALDDLIVKTLLAVESKILAMAAAGSSSGFELYGFDILLEGDEMKPWLLEVNVFPSLSSSSPMDKRIKTVLVSDMFQLIGVPFQDAQSAIEQLDQDKQARLHGVKSRRSSAAGVVAKTTAKRTVDDLLQQQQRHQSASAPSGLGRAALELSHDELQMIKQMEEEELRRGHFQRIFPTAESFDKYHALFDTPRVRTVLCMLWLQRARQKYVMTSTAATSKYASPPTTFHPIDKTGVLEINTKPLYAFLRDSGASVRADAWCGDTSVRTSAMTDAEQRALPSPFAASRSMFHHYTREWTTRMTVANAMLGVTTACFLLAGVALQVADKIDPQDALPRHRQRRRGRT